MSASGNKQPPSPTPPYKIIITDSLDQPDHAAEIWLAGELWAVVTFDRQAKDFSLEVRNTPFGESQHLPLAWVVEALHGAERRMREKGYGTDAPHSPMPARDLPDADVAESANT